MKRFKLHYNISFAPLMHLQIQIQVLEKISTVRRSYKHIFEQAKTISISVFETLQKGFVVLQRN